jgi:hypothetical protein
MRANLIRVAVLLCVVGLTPSAVTAGPISDFATILVGDGFELRGGFVLTAEDLATLAALDDNGWHLGWFKRKLRSNNGASTDDSDSPDWSIPGSSTGPGSGAGQHPPTPVPLIPGFPLVPGIPGLTDDPLSPVAGEPLEDGPASAAPIAAPEPKALVLLGAGLLLLARRVKGQRPPR